MNREAWLHAALERLRHLFSDAGYELPPVIHQSIGFPSKGALARRKQRIGECWSHNSSADGNFHILISPLLSDPVKVLGVQVHELVHVAVGTEAGHKAPFARCAKQVGLTGKMTATEESPELVEKLKAIIADIGDYPHAALSAMALERKKQTTRLIKAVCPGGCASEGKVYAVRITAVHINNLGAPVCPGCEERMVGEDGEAFDGETDDGDE